MSSVFKKLCVGNFVAPILRDARLQRAPQDEVVISGANSDPHGEEAHRAVSNHVARLLFESEWAAMLPLCQNPRKRGASQRENEGLDSSPNQPGTKHYRGDDGGL